MIWCVKMVKKVSNNKLNYKNYKVGLLLYSIVGLFLFENKFTLVQIDISLFTV